VCRRHGFPSSADNAIDDRALGLRTRTRIQNACGFTDRTWWRRRDKTKDLLHDDDKSGAGVLEMKYTFPNRNSYGACVQRATVRGGQPKVSRPDGNFFLNHRKPCSRQKRFANLRLHGLSNEHEIRTTFTNESQLGIHKIAIRFSLRRAKQQLIEFKLIFFFFSLFMRF